MEAEYGERYMAAGSLVNDAIRHARAALAAIDAAGFAIVPKEPTEEMETAYWRAQGMDRAPCDQTWDAMLAAAPKVTA
jgi:hypothetical protein